MQLVSRHNDQSEEQELADFAQETARLGVFRNVKSVFYDSVAGWAVIETNTPEHSPGWQRIRHSAERTFCQYECDGAVYHRIDCRCSQCRDDIDQSRKVDSKPR